MSANQCNIHKSKEQLKTKSQLVQRLNNWMTKIGQNTNTEQQSYYK